jgi:hypothetical protein
MGDFITHYLDYAKSTPEVPMNYSRWAGLIGLGAYLGRQYYFEHGNFLIHPNIYGMLIGVAGARKGTAIKLMKRVFTAAGYTSFSAERTSKEKFLLDLSGEADPSEPQNVEDILEKNLFANNPSQDTREVFIAIDEFNDFIGNGNIEFISMLGNMWNYQGVYTNRIKSGKSVSISNPTISIFGGNTPTNFALAFPPAIVGQGFLSRMIIIHGEPNGKRVTFPPAPTPESTEAIVSHLRQIRATCQGPATLTATAEHLLDAIYQAQLGVADARFESYSQRRLDHLIKLCIIHSAARSSTTITERDVVVANTILVHAEQFMPKALGEFGKAKNSDVAHRVLSIIQSNHGVTNLKDIWHQVSNDLENLQALGTILTNLEEAGKLQRVTKPISGFLPRHEVLDMDKYRNFIDLTILSPEERNMKV